MTKRIEVSVLIVSDWIDDTKRDWHEEHEIVRAISRQEFPHPLEVLLVEDSRFRDVVPSDSLQRILPSLNICFWDAHRSSELKDRAVREAMGKYVAVLEADCVPAPDWLRRLYSTLREHPEFSAISGRTTYGDRTSLRRVLTLLDRGFNDPGDVAETSHLSNNAALCERAFLLEYPYPDAPNPFVSARQRISNMQRDGHRFLADPHAVVIHAMQGWAFIKDVRRNIGFGDMSGSERKNHGSIPRLLASRLRAEWADCMRLHRRYLRWYDWPLLLLFLGLDRVLEIPGMLDALREQDMPLRTSYR